MEVPRNTEYNASLLVSFSLSIFIPSICSPAFVLHFLFSLTQCGICTGDAESDGIADCQQILSFFTVPSATSAPSHWFENVRAQDLFPLDYDFDGFMDLLFVGETTRLYRNMGGEKYEWRVDVQLPNMQDFAVAIGDFTNDNALDLFLIGRRLSDMKVVALQYKNTADPFQPNFVQLEENCQSNVPSVYHASASVADLNRGML